MLTSLALIFLLGMILGEIFKKLRLPSLVGMIITGIILGPYVLNLLDESILGISADLRQLALVIILMRAGLSLDIDDLKKVGRPAIMMCFVPALFEIAGTAILAPKLLGITLTEALIMGSVIAAVSPAVIVPRIIKIMEEGRGTKKSIPQLILAGASADDVFVIVLFTSFTSLAQQGAFSPSVFLQVPVSIVCGALLGVVIGLIMSRFFKKVHMRDSLKILILLSFSFLFIQAENSLKGIFPFSGLIAVMAMGLAIYRDYNVLAKRLSEKYNKLWVAAEILLFVLVGACADPSYALKYGVSAVLVVLGALLFRMAGVFVCMLGTKLNGKEKLFCMISYIPKATVQAAIGAVPLSMGLSCGMAVLTVAVMSIFITAPLGAFLIDIFYKKLLPEE